MPNKMEVRVISPKRAHLKRALLEGAAKYRLGMRILDYDKGWWREAIYFELEGTAQNIQLFNTELSEITDRWNHVK